MAVNEKTKLQKEKKNKRYVTFVDFDVNILDKGNISTATI